MSTTIGFGYSPNEGVDVFLQLRELASKHGYGLLFGVDSAESDVREGLKFAKAMQQWTNVAIIQSPIDDEVGLAFGIHEELTAFETKYERPQFFDYLEEMCSYCDRRCGKLSFFFASEWTAKDRIRFSYGAVSDLISLLSLPGHWGMRYLMPETGRYQDSDETPLIFDIRPPSSL